MRRYSLNRYLSPVAPVVASWLFLAACTTTNTVKIGETDKPLRAEMIVRQVRVHPCLNVTGYSCDYEEAIVVVHHGLSSREFRYGCPALTTGFPRGEISTDTRAGHDRFAYRCGSAEAWQVVYIGSGNRTFPDCRKVDSGRDFNWDAVPDLAGVAPRLVARCPGIAFEELAAQLEADGGDRLVADLLIATFALSAPRKTSMDRLQAWDDAYLKLSSSGQNRLSPLFRSAILGDSTVIALERALRHGNLSDPAYVQAMQERVRTILNSPPGFETDTVMDVMLRSITKAEPAEAARLGCHELEREVKRGANVYLAGALLAVARAGYACPAVLAAFENSRCAAQYYCPEGQRAKLCGSDDLAADVQAGLNGPPGALNPNLADRTLLAAALALPQSREILRVWHARHSYTIDQPAEPSCEGLYVLGKKNVPCHCFTAVPDSACTESSRSETTCVFAVDDANRRITRVVSP